MSGFLHAWSVSGHSVCVLVCAQGRKAPVHNYADLQIINLIWMCFNSSSHPFFSARSLSFEFPAHSQKHLTHVCEHPFWAILFRFQRTLQIDWFRWTNLSRLLQMAPFEQILLSEWFKYSLKYSKGHSPVSNYWSTNESVNNSVQVSLFSSV